MGASALPMWAHITHLAIQTFRPTLTIIVALWRSLTASVHLWLSLTQRLSELWRSPADFVHL